MEITDIVLKEHWLILHGDTPSYDRQVSYVVFVVRTFMWLAVGVTSVIRLYL